MAHRGDEHLRGSIQVHTDTTRSLLTDHSVILPPLEREKHVSPTRISLNVLDLTPQLSNAVITHSLKNSGDHVDFPHVLAEDDKWLTGYHVLLDHASQHPPLRRSDQMNLAVFIL